MEPNSSIFRLPLYHLCIEIKLQNKCRPHRFQLYQIIMCKDSLYFHQQQHQGGQVNSSEIQIHPNWIVYREKKICSAVQMHLNCKELKALSVFLPSSFPASRKIKVPSDCKAVENNNLMLQHQSSARCKTLQLHLNWF